MRPTSSVKRRYEGVSGADRRLNAVLRTLRRPDFQHDTPRTVKATNARTVENPAAANTRPSDSHSTAGAENPNGPANESPKSPSNAAYPPTCNSPATEKPSSSAMRAS